MELRVERVLLQEGSTVGFGFGRSNTDPNVVFVFGMDWRSATALGMAVSESWEPVPVEVPEWAIVDRLEDPQA